MNNIPGNYERSIIIYVFCLHHNRDDHWKLVERLHSEYLARLFGNFHAVLPLKNSHEIWISDKSVTEK